MREKMMPIWWRAWNDRNDIIFRKGDAYLESSIPSYKITSFHAGYYEGAGLATSN
jgi:hypothetical protein